MQGTRTLILDYLKMHGEATVDELAAVLDLTSVTVRHHLDILRTEELVGPPVIRHRNTPGRPQYSYALTHKASEHFPKNYCDLAAKLLDEMKASSPPLLVNVIFEGVAQRLSADAPAPVPGEPLAARLDRAVAYLNTQGYVAKWEQDEQGVWLHTCNCPYQAIAGHNQELCSMDLALISRLLGVAPQRASRVIEGASTCAYLLPRNAETGLIPNKAD